MIHIADLKCFSALGCMFCMLIAYFDESYNPGTITIGGWLAHDHTLKQIERDWLARIDYENRKSKKQGMKPISRFHAADCSSRVGEFDGWSKDRQNLFTERLIDIIVKHRPYGMVYGASVDDLAEMYPATQRFKLRKVCYKICVREVLRELCEVMQNCYPGEKVTLFHDRGEFYGCASEVFNSWFVPFCPDQFVTMAPLSWEQCPALQPVDLIAYEGMKLCDRKFQGNDEFRRAIRKLFANKIPASVFTIKRGILQTLVKDMWAQEEKERPDD